MRNTPTVFRATEPYRASATFTPLWSSPQDQKIAARIDLAIDAGAIALRVGAQAALPQVIGASPAARANCVAKATSFHS
jgi:hypothetical protein